MEEFHSGSEMEDVERQLQALALAEPATVLEQIRTLRDRIEMAAGVSLERYAAFLGAAPGRG